MAREGGVGGLDGRHQAYRDIFTASPGMSYLGPPPNLYPCNRIHHYPRGQQVAHPTVLTSSRIHHHPRGQQIAHPTVTSVLRKHHQDRTVALGAEY